jgi:hypothetical protein
VRAGRANKKFQALETLRKLALRFKLTKADFPEPELYSGTGDQEKLVARFDVNGADRAYNYLLGNIHDAGLPIRFPSRLDYPDRVLPTNIHLGSHIVVRAARRGQALSEVENVTIFWENASMLPKANNGLILHGNKPELYEAIEALAVLLDVPYTWPHA